MSDCRHAPSKFSSAFLAEADSNHSMPFDRFMELALYHPEVGYYRRDRLRIGYGDGSDFFTAATSGKVFGELVAAACITLLRRPAGDFTFVEIGSETEKGVLEGVAHPFKSVVTYRLGQTPGLSGPCVVFSNELFDAQPFRRFIRSGGQWRERGVSLRDNLLLEVELNTPVPTVLPANAEEGYVIDAPIAATALIEQIAQQEWSGLFVACDYGKSWREITEACPAGTARAYYRHAQINDLLTRPGEQDLTCHVCWDWLSAALESHGFNSPQVESQESFFIRHAADFIAQTSLAEAQRFSPRKVSLLQLLHPAHLGQKFQVLHASRD